MARDSLRRHRLTVKDYYRMGEVGILRPDARIELIEGEIIDMAPIGSRHAGTVEQVAEILRRAVGDRAMVRSQQPISLDEHSEPEPDITVVVFRDDHYKGGHPGPAEVRLVVEVADTSRHYDRDVKVPLYARFGIPEVWIIDLKSRRLSRYRDPGTDTYAREDSPDLEAPLSIESVAAVRLSLEAVFTD